MSDLLNIKAVCAKLGGVHPATVYRRVNDGTLPKPVKIGPRVARWMADEVEAALQQMANARNTDRQE